MDAKLQPEGAPPPAGGKEQTEFYLYGNVIIRMRPKIGPPQTLRAAEIYYDVDRERAIALGQTGIQRRFASSRWCPDNCTNPFNVYGQEIDKLDAENYQMKNVSFNASKLPSDPGLQLDAPRMTMTDRVVQLRNVFVHRFTDPVSQLSWMRKSSLRMMLFRSSREFRSSISPGTGLRERTAGAVRQFRGGRKLTFGGQIYST